MRKKNTKEGRMRKNKLKMHLKKIEIKPRFYDFDDL
jgi:hypothetical protein